MNIWLTKESAFWGWKMRTGWSPGVTEIFYLFLKIGHWWDADQDTHSCSWRFMRLLLFSSHFIKPAGGLSHALSQVRQGLSIWAISPLPKGRKVDEEGNKAFSGSVSPAWSNSEQLPTASCALTHCLPSLCREAPPDWHLLVGMS